MSAVAPPELHADPQSIVTRAFTLLTAFRTQPVLGVSELSRRTGIPRTSVHRLVNQLVDVGALSRVGVRFRLGPTLFELGNLHYSPKIRETLQPFLEDLQRLSSGDVGLLELVGPDVIVIQAARERASTSTLMKLGTRIGASTCAGGWILQAHTATRPTAAQRSLISTGFAVERQTIDVGRTAVAAPVANRNGRVLGALMVSVPTSIEGEKLERVVNATVDFARTLTIAGRTAGVDYLAAARRKTNNMNEPTGRRNDG